MRGALGADRTAGVDLAMELFGAELMRGAEFIRGAEFTRGAELIRGAEFIRGPALIRGAEALDGAECPPLRIAPDDRPPPPRDFCALAFSGRVTNATATKATQ